VRYVVAAGVPVHQYSFTQMFLPGTLAVCHVDNMFYLWDPVCAAWPGLEGEVASC
jgi:hypothetical protein